MIIVCPRGAPQSQNRERSRPSDEATCNCDVFDLMKIKRSSQRHVSSGRPFFGPHEIIPKLCININFSEMTY